jgi:4-hydroxybenzoate polyprenyltransferase
VRLPLAFLQLIRWPNLVFIAITQALFYYCILLPVIQAAGGVATVHPVMLIWLMIASVLIAAAGYIINDYFDLNIDLVNKPDKLVVEKVINRRWVILWHLLLSLVGLLFSGYVSILLNSYWLAIANAACIVLLFIYSMSLKKQLLSGNLLISLLTAWVILVLALAEMHSIQTEPEAIQEAHRKIFRLGVLYAGFAFIISLIREVVKDMEDREGDRRHGCTTMPIAWGMNATKVFVAVWIIVLMAVLLVLQVYVVSQFQWWLSALYCIAAIVVPLLIVLRKLHPAQSPAEFHRLSSLIKLVMLTGILSMVFFYLYI